jgi:DNA-binding HxlR family transcriptional regulator
VFAQRWTPLILRELLAGSHRFSELQRGLPHIPRALLVQRLRALERAGLVERRPARAGRGFEYHLSPAGLSFRPVVEALGQWGYQWAAEQLRPDNLDAGLLMWFLRRRVKVDRLPAARVTVQFEFPRGRQALLLARPAPPGGRPVPCRPRLRHRPVRHHRRQQLHAGVPGPSRHHSGARRRLGEHGGTPGPAPRLAAVAVLALALLAALTALPRDHAEATPPSGVAAELLARGTVAHADRVRVAGISLRTRGPVDVATVHVTFQPGGTTGWHVHPGPALVTVKTGQLTLNRAAPAPSAPARRSWSSAPPTSTSPATRPAASPRPW